MNPSEPPRVVHLSTVHHGHDNRVFNKEARAVVEAGYDFHLVISADHDGLDEGIPVVALRRHEGRVQRVLLSQRDAWRALRRLRPQLLQVHDPELIPLALAWGRLHDCRTVYDAHEDLVGQIETKPYLNRFTRPLARTAARALVGLADRGMDAVVAATEPVAARYRADHVVVVRNYPWLGNYDRQPDPVPGRVVYVGDLTEERKLSFMIELVRRARDVVPQAHLVLAGRPLGGCVATLDRAVAEGLVEHRGLIVPTQVPELLASAQLGLVMLAPLPNYVRSLPTKLFEYMAAGVPFVASDFPAWRRRFEPYRAGVFVDSEDVEAALGPLVDLLADADRCAALGRSGRRAVEEGLTFESQASALIGLTERLVGPAAH